MSQNFDDILMAAQDGQQPQQPNGATLEPFDKDAYMEKKQSERDAAFRLADVTAERAASSPATYATYPNVQARFHRYRAHNAPLKKVFDISQTRAVQQQTEIHRDQRLVMKALVSNPPCRLEVNDGKVPANAAAIYSSADKTLYVRHGLSFDDMFRALARELAFAHLDKLIPCKEKAFLLRKIGEEVM